MQDKLVNSSVLKVNDVNQKEDEKSLHEFLNNSLIEFQSFKNRQKKMLYPELNMPLDGERDVLLLLMVEFVLVVEEHSRTATTARTGSSNSSNESDER